MAEVIEINDIESLSSYHLDWSMLHRQTPGATFFNTLEWLQVFWKHNAKGKKLRVLIVRSNDSTIGIVPLIEQAEKSRLGSMRVLTYPLDNWGSQFVPLGSSLTATMTIAMKHIASTPRSWDLLEPRWIPNSGSRTQVAMQLAGMNTSIMKQNETSILDFSKFENWEDYLAKQSFKSRKQLRKSLRDSESNKNAYRFIRYRPLPFRKGGGDPGWKYYEDCHRLAQKSWQSKSDDGNTLSDQSVSDFLNDAHEQAARLGMVDMCLIYKEDDPVAYCYNYHHKSEVIGLRTGYDPQVSGAGTMLMACFLKDSFLRNDQRLDFGVGLLKYKARLRTDVEESYKITHVGSNAWVPLALQTARRIKYRLQSNKTTEVI